MSHHGWSLTDLGWNAHLAAQVAGEVEGLCLVRVMAVHRDALDVAGPDYDGRVLPFGLEVAATVGDWVVLDQTSRRPIRLLVRRSVFKRKRPGEARDIQLIAANIDTVFLVTSANDEFNPARLERYLAIAREAEVAPVVVITKADLLADCQSYLAVARGLTPGLIALAMDARSDAAVASLRPWLEPGQTVALLGSSGVGKSTLVNSLIGVRQQPTAAIRESDARGRHTTTGRSLHRLDSGAWLIDTPGMRELQLVDAADGIEEVFDDVAELATACRFSDCRHGSEPGCAIQAAVAAGDLGEDRLARYQKLVREERHNSESIAEARARSRKGGKVAKGIMEGKARRREGN